MRLGHKMQIKKTTDISKRTKKTFLLKVGLDKKKVSINYK